MPLQRYIIENMQNFDSQLIKRQEIITADKYNITESIDQELLIQYLMIKVAKFICISKKIQMIISSLPKEADQNLKKALNEKVSQIYRNPQIKGPQKQKFSEIFKQLVKDKNQWDFTKKLQITQQKINQLKKKMDQKKSNQ